jgi:AcrR family transcriptional regulator
MFNHQEKHSTELSSATESRLLEAAGEIFAEVGYRAATVRQICEKAGANIAAVNYHFGDKEGLYMAVLRSVPDAHAEKFPADRGLPPGATAEQRLAAYIESLLNRVFDEGRPGWHTKIMAREMIEPTRALDTLVADVALPVHQELASIVRELLGSRASEDAMRLCTLSILSQCVYYHHARSVLSRLYPEQKYDSQDIAQLADHITRFSQGALQHCAQGISRGSNAKSRRALQLAKTNRAPIKRARKTDR